MTSQDDAQALERAADLLSSGHPSRGDRTVARRAQRAAVVLREMAGRLRDDETKLKPTWDGEHYNTYEVNLGTWTGSVEFDHKPTDEDLVDAVMERIAESYMDFNRHGRFAIDELTLINVEDM